MGCTLPVTIGQGVLLFAGLKLFAYLALFLLLLLLALIFQQPWKIYLFAAGWFKMDESGGVFRYGDAAVVI